MKPKPKAEFEKENSTEVLEGLLDEKKEIQNNLRRIEVEIQRQVEWVKFLFNDDEKNLKEAIEKRKGEIGDYSKELEELFKEKERGIENDK